MVRRVGRHVGGGPEPEEERERRERDESLKEALSHWASGVSIVAVREGDDGAADATGPVHALTVGAFIPVTLDPPTVLISLGPNASVRPYLETDTTFVINLLAMAQKGLASRYADTFPVGPSPFAAHGPPVIDGALASLICTVVEMLQRGDHTLVIGRVVSALTGPEAPALAYFRRNYYSVG